MRSFFARLLQVGTDTYQAVKRVSDMLWAKMIALHVFLFGVVIGFLKLQAWALSLLSSKLAVLGGAVTTSFESGFDVRATVNTLHAGGATLFTYMEKINYVLPLSETLAMLVVLFDLWVIGLLYRAIKSWIPTVN